MIEFIGLKELKPEEIDLVNKLVPEYYNKFIRDITPENFVLHIKKHKKEGNRVKYSIKARLDNPKLESSSFDWELSTALHKALSKIEHEIRHRFKKHD